MQVELTEEEIAEICMALEMARDSTRDDLSHYKHTDFAYSAGERSSLRHLRSRQLVIQDLLQKLSLLRL